MNVSNASIPNELSYERTERIDEPIDRRPRIVDGGDAVAEPALRNIGGGAPRSMTFRALSQSFVGAQPTIPQSSKTSDSCIEESHTEQSDVDGQRAISTPPSNSELSDPNSPLPTRHLPLESPAFPRLPGETPRAYSAF